MPVSGWGGWRLKRNSGSDRNVLHLGCIGVNILVVITWDYRGKGSQGNTEPPCITTYDSTVLCLVVQSCPSPCDSMDCSPPDSSVHGDSPGKNIGVGCQALLQGIFPTQGSNLGLPHGRRILYCLSDQGSPRILEWVAYPFSRETFTPRN